MEQINKFKFSKQVIIIESKIMKDVKCLQKI